METGIRNVRDIETDKRQWIEAVVGHQLQENQQVIIHVIDIGIEPNDEVRQRALAEAGDIARQGRANAAAQSPADSEVDAAIDEALQHARQQSR